MMDTISKQRAIDAIRDFQAQITCSFSEMWLNGMNEGFDHAVGVIELMETVDAVPVIRCKDCKYFESDHIEPVSNITVIVAHEICTKWGGWCKTNENGFCHLAERREE